MDARELRRNPEQIASLIDHTNVEPDSTEDDIRKLCTEVHEYEFCSAVVVPYHAELAAALIGDVANVVVVVGFPYGVQNSRAKQLEVEEVIEYVDEVDMVMNRTAFANGDTDFVREDIAAVKQIVGDKPLKCIIESPVLGEDDIRTAARLAVDAGADFVKTAVGYDGGCDPREVEAIREVVPDHVGVKASGGIGTFGQAMEMIEGGATRIGASSSVEIIESIPA